MSLIISSFNEDMTPYAIIHILHSGRVAASVNDIVITISLIHIISDADVTNVDGTMFSTN